VSKYTHVIVAAVGQCNKQTCKQHLQQYPWLQHMATVRALQGWSLQLANGVASAHPMVWNVLLRVSGFAW
jgi:hypothetical protein